jgi:flagellar hook protein FlgE
LALSVALNSVRLNETAVALSIVTVIWGSSARGEYLRTCGTVVTQGDRLDLAIDGEGFFLLRDGPEDLLVRHAAFGVGSGFYVTDPATGYRLQRRGTQGETYGFQSASSTDIRIPYDRPIPPRATTSIAYNGNLSADGEAFRETQIGIFDSQGVSHTLSATFVATNSANRWDLVLTSITGNVDVSRGRIPGINFTVNGAYAGLGDPLAGYFEVAFRDIDPDRLVPISIDFGTVGAYDGLSLLGGPSRAHASWQDGYAAGWLSKMWVTVDGMLVGRFTNGLESEIAQIAVVVPEPATAAILCLGGLAMLVRRRRKWLRLSTPPTA